MSKSAIERLTEFHEYLKSTGYGGRNKFERAIGKSDGYLSNALKKNSSVGSDVLMEIRTMFPELNIDWLISGEGEMLRSDLGEKQLDVTEGKPYYELTHFEPKPHIDSIYATLGAPNGFSLAVKSDECEKISIPFVNDYDFSIRGRGDSMINRENPHKSINEGDIIACKLWTSRTHIRWGEVYCLATSNGVIVKKIMPAEREGLIKCVSYNEEDGYKPYEMPVEEVHDWAIVTAVIHISNW